MDQDKHKMVSSDTNIQFQKLNIPWTKHARYLGATVDQQLKFNEHIWEVERKVETMKDNLYPL